MASPESLVKALAEGLISGLLATKEEKPAKVKPTVVKADDVQRAVRTYIDQILGQADQPQQEELFPTAEEDYGERIVRRVEEARMRSEAREEGPPEGSFDPNAPGSAPWQSPIR